CDATEFYRLSQSDELANHVIFLLQFFARCRVFPLQANDREILLVHIDLEVIKLIMIDDIYFVVVVKRVLVALHVGKQFVVCFDLTVTNVVVKQQVFEEIGLVEVLGKLAFISQAFSYLNKFYAFAKLELVTRFFIILVKYFYSRLEEGDVCSSNLFNVAVKAVHYKRAVGVVLVYPGKGDSKNIAPGKGVRDDDFL